MIFLHSSRLVKTRHPWTRKHNIYKVSACKFIGCFFFRKYGGNELHKEKSTCETIIYDCAKVATYAGVKSLDCDRHDIVYCRVICLFLVFFYKYRLRDVELEPRWNYCCDCMHICVGTDLFISTRVCLGRVPKRAPNDRNVRYACAASACAFNWAHAAHARCFDRYSAPVLCINADTSTRRAQPRRGVVTYTLIEPHRHVLQQQQKF